MEGEEPKGKGKVTEKEKEKGRRMEEQDVEGVREKLKGKDRRGSGGRKVRREGNKEEIKKCKLMAVI